MRVLICWATLHGIRGFKKKKEEKNNNNKKQIDLAHEILILIVSAMQVCAYCACVTLQQNQVSHKVKCSKDIVLKSEDIISHKHFLTLFLQQHFSF